VKRLSAVATRGLARARGKSGGYGREFYVEHAAIARSSADVVVPLVMELMGPRSVVDVGCGSADWLAVFGTHGVDDVLGIDSEDVPDDLLAVPSTAVRRHDLSRPLELDRRFDLVVCLEVAEHLAPEKGVELIAALTGLGPLVLFSAAIPHQGGMNHLNEQWPDHWAEIFGRHGYVAIDCLRRKVWRNPDVAWWYAQNMLLFAERNELPGRPELSGELELMGSSQLSLVHPRCYESRRRALRRLI
jgi:hypothetical protein